MTRTVSPARKLRGSVSALLVATGKGFETQDTDEIALDFDGIIIAGARGERHYGATRKADARVPWYPRGTPIRNSRQISIVADDELAAIAQGLDLPQVDASWLGANLVIAGVPDLSMLPRGTRLMFQSGASLAVEDQNAPCRGPGKVIQARHPDREDLEFGFVKVAKRLRGLVAFVERAGVMRRGDPVEVRIPEQWIY